MQVRAATAQDAAGIVALHKAANPFGDWFRNPLRRLGRVPYEDLTPLERYLHGGFGMDLSLFRRHLHEYQSRGFPILVVEEGGRIVGACEVWLDEEPLPFGRYAAIESLASGSPPNPQVERDLVERAAERVRKLGYAALDLSPGHSGGASVVKELGFERIWDTRAFTAAAVAVRKPEAEFETRYLTGDYADLRGLLAMNHGEPARWRYETLTSRWPAAQLAGLQDVAKIVGMAVDAADLRFAVIAARWAWAEPPVAEVDVWLPPNLVRDAAAVGDAFSIAAEVARRLGPETVVVRAPPTAKKPLKALGFAADETPDPWMRLAL